jgi:hypothetical protein
MAGFLPPSAGPFTFPAPYGTQGVRLTSPADGTILPVGYSYWPNINSHAGLPILRVLIGRREDVPVILTVDKTTFAVEPRGLDPLPGTTEGWYWSWNRPDVLYVPRGADLLRYTVGTGEAVSVCRVDGEIWQAHSSRAEDVHSFTVRHAGGGVSAGYFDERAGAVTYIDVADDYDECQIDKSGAFLIIKEGAINRIIDLASGQSTEITNEAGAVGHSDCGFGYVVGEDDMAADPGSFRLWRLNGIHTDGIMYRMHGWDPMARHVSHCNAYPGEPAGQSVLISSAHRSDLPRANELVMVPLDGSQMCRVVAPNLIDLDAPGGGDEYWKTPKANLDPAGQWACWTANMGTDRLDAFLVRI